MFCDETNRISNKACETVFNEFIAIRQRKLREIPLLMCTWCNENAPETVDNCEACAVYYIKQSLIESEEE
jgi:hypothetical protein